MEQEIKTAFYYQIKFYIFHHETSPLQKFAFVYLNLNEA